MHLLSLFDRLRRSRLLDKYATTAAMAEGGGDMARRHLTSYNMDEERVAELRQEFKSRYRNFRSLLHANNNALDSMAALEKAVQECGPIPFSFVRTTATSITEDVNLMIRGLNRIAPGKHHQLLEVFQNIRAEINSCLEPDKPEKDDRFVIAVSEVNQTMSDLVGDKMARLGEIGKNTGLEIPIGFVITSSAYAYFLQENGLDTKIAEQLQSVDFDDLAAVQKSSQKLQSAIKEAKVPLPLQRAMENSFDQLQHNNSNITLALRSSATGEDSVKTSSAGQYLSKLNVGKTDFIDAYKAVVASKYSTEAMTYRYHHGLIDDQVSMAVGCLPMVNSAAGGVIYTRNPIDPEDNNIYINSCWGIPKPVVGGDSPCDLFVASALPPHELVETVIAEKEFHYKNNEQGGVEKTKIKEDLRSKPSLTGAEVEKLVQIASRLESHYKEPQDIEWCIDNQGRIKILQCRPLTGLERNKESPDEKTGIASPKRLIINGGTSISPGIVTGKVFWVENSTDLNRFPNDAILCAQMADPKWAPLLNRAKGIIVETGGFAGHLASIVREFKIPGLFGVESLKSRLVDGTIVTLDAENSSIYLGGFDALPVQDRKKDHLLAKSPVYSKLKEVSRIITPLHLTDPESLKFRPAGCTTLHDITRYIHEKSVEEMFNFGKHHHFLERSGKQLYYKVPMQWWILNLDDGYIKETNSRYVRLENIASLPMLALWEGMIAIPWEGPPPIDGKGLLSVMFQATTNRSLTTSGKAGFADKNYFMISRNFCNLSSRLGFHFTTIESIISEENPDENYISFKFKGGAADFTRRSNRTQFLGELLENYGFSIYTRRDILVAKLGHPDTDFVKARLAILGYLMIHSRQIDMIMMNRSTVSYYRSKFEKDIATILN